MPIYIFHRKDGFTPLNLVNEEAAMSLLKVNDEVLRLEFAPTGKIIWEKVIDPPKPLRFFASELGKFKVGDRVRKIKGSQWQGKIVGAYSTELTFDGYVVESEAHAGSCQIYPASALEIL